MKKAARPRPLVLMILDGYGTSLLDEGNAVKAAKQPHLTQYLREYPIAGIHAAGVEVGLPWGEMGNSETGHKNMGSGLIAYQPLPRIAAALADKSFFKNPAFRAAVKHVKASPKAILHVLGIVSNGGVHGHIDHLIALLALAADAGIGERTIVHAWLDGRDSPPDSAGNFVKQLTAAMQQTGAGRLGSMIGRYYAMDRNQNWGRTQAAYDLLVHGKGTTFPTWQEAAAAAYKNADTRNFETAPAMILHSDTIPFRPIQDGDAVICTNYRPDRAQQLTSAFIQPHFKHFPTTAWRRLLFVTMSQYSQELPSEVAFPEADVEHPVGRVVSEHKLKQLRIAESEKFAHVTYFFNGGREQPFAGEDHVSIPSLNVKDYSRAPAMSAAAISDRVITEIAKGKYDLIVMNYANPDMVAHTGNVRATIKALELLDPHIDRVVTATLAAGGAVLITCDHGHAESVVNQLTHARSTDHTANPVPVIYITPDNRQSTPKTSEQVDQILVTPIGILCDVAPTILEILGLPKPEQMTAQSLLGNLT